MAAASIASEQTKMASMGGRPTPSGSSFLGSQYSSSMYVVP
jgi:hypothetical protein